VSVGTTGVIGGAGDGVLFLPQEITKVNVDAIKIFIAKFI